MNTANMVHTLAKHPYLWALAGCLLLNPFFFGSMGNSPAGTLWIVFFLVIGAGSVILLKGCKTGKLSVKRTILLEILLFILVLILLKVYQSFQYKALWFFAGGVGLVSVLYFLADKKQFPVQMKSFWIMGCGFFLKFYYILTTSIYTRQHDIGRMKDGSGHCGYIWYLFQNHHLSDFDVRTKWQFYHPPLHHAICAFWLELNRNFLGVPENPSNESLQTLTLFYSMCIMITGYQLLRHFQIDGKPLYFALCILNFHPSFILFSGSINNDVLSVAFMAGAILCTLQWYRNQTVFNILKIALCIGLGMMTKISVALVSLPIALVFLIVFCQNMKTNLKKYLLQFLYFGIVCVPLAMWFPIRNYLEWNVPLNYVAKLGTDIGQYLGDTSFLSRITDFSGKQFSPVYEQWAERGSFNDFNPLTVLLKTSLFGEFINEKSFENFPAVNTVSVFLFWLNVLICIFAFVCMILVCWRNSQMKATEKLFFVSFYLLTIFSFYKMCADYPFVCTMNFRYITLTVLTGILFSSLFLQEKQKSGKGLVIASEMTAMLFSLSSGIIYLALGCQ